MKPTILVIGASGDVGRGITSELLRSGYRVVAAGRDSGKLAGLQSQLASIGPLQTIAGSVEDAASASALRDRVRALVGPLGGVITSVNMPPQTVSLQAMPGPQLLETLRANVVTHLVAASVFVPALEPGGIFLGIGGGMADVVVPGYGAIAMCQAAQRAMYRALAAELPNQNVRLQELMIHSMVAGDSNRATAHPKWITDADVGLHVLAILEKPDLFPETILALKSRKQVGQPQLAQA